MYLFQGMDAPQGFSGEFYEIVTDHLGLSVGEVIRLITNGMICQNGQCWDLGDVGSNCC
jgi:hypothetical protein